MPPLNFQMQICKNCGQHKWCTRHKEERYKKLSEEIKSRLQELDDKVEIRQVSNPRIGAFEIKCNGKNLFSKLKLGYFPDTDLFLQRVNEYLKNESEKKYMSKTTKQNNENLNQANKSYNVKTKQIYFISFEKEEQKRKDEEKKKQELRKKQEQKKRDQQKKRQEEQQQNRKLEEKKKKEDQKKIQQKKKLDEKKQLQNRKLEEKKKKDQQIKKKQEEIQQQKNIQIKNQTKNQNDQNNYEQQFQQNTQNLKHYILIQFHNVQIKRKTDIIGSAQPYWKIQSKINTQKGSVNKLQQKFKIQFNPEDDTFINLLLMDQDITQSQLIAQFVLHLNKVTKKVDSKIQFQQQMKFEGNIAAKISFSTIYIQIPFENWTLKIFNAQISIDTELFGKMDPFVNIFFGQQKFKTNVHEDGGKKPIWNQSFNIFVFNSKEQKLELQVLQKDVISDDFIGKAIIIFDELKNERKFNAMLMRENKKVGQIIIQATKR